MVKTNTDNKKPIYCKGVVDILSLYYRKGNSMFKTDRAFYKQLKVKYPNLAKYSDQQILAYIEGFNRRITETTIDWRDGIMLPANVGLLMVTTMGFRTKAIDPVMSKKLGKDVYYRNDHSDGFGGGVYYSTVQTKDSHAKPTRMYSNCEFWYFTPNTKYKDLIRDAYFTDWKKFHVLPKSRRYADMNETYDKYLKTKQIVKKIKDNYNEFDFGNDK